MTLSRAARLARSIVLGLGVVYLLLAVAGFIQTGWGEFGLEEPLRLFGILGVSTLLNFVHTFVGAVAVLAALRGASSTFAIPATIMFLAMAVFGATSRVFADTGDPLNLTWWNVALYLLSSVTCGYVYSLRLRAADHGGGS
jgi:hypothetical protein